MVDTELLRRYPFFKLMNDQEVAAVAKLSQEVVLKKGDDIFQVGNPADALYFLVEGRAELYFILEDPNDALLSKEYYITDINPGEIFGISSMLDEPMYSGTVHAINPCRVLKIPAPELRALADANCALGYCLMREIARAALERLHYTRLQLASATVEASDTY